MVRPIRTKNCKICEIEFLPVHNNQKCCDAACSKENHKRLSRVYTKRKPLKVIIVCDVCQQTFHAKRGAKRCSPECKKVGKVRAGRMHYERNREHIAALNKKNNQRNPESARAASKRWRDRNREKVLAQSRTPAARARARDGYYRREYGVSSAFVDAERERGCQICGGFERLHTDHCHETGAYRGILCLNCNTGIGKLGDNVDGLMRAVEYLMKSQDVLGGI